MTESSPQPNEQPQPRRRNIYDYDGEYEFPTLCSIGPRRRGLGLLLARDQS